MKKTVIISAIAILISSNAAAFAGEVISVEIKGGNFRPTTIEVPANQKVELHVKNNEKVEVEFESYELNREVKIKPSETATIFIGPLSPGNYPVFDDKNPAAQATVVAK